jgi:capsular exopolysaccharide synthesis family protein
MSNIFDALKKAKSEQVEKLFGPTRRKSEVKSVPRIYAPLEQKLEEFRPDLVPLESAKEKVTVTTLESNPAFIAPPPPQLTGRNGAKHPQVTLRADKGKLIALDINTPASEQFSVLRARLVAISRKQELRTICVTSSVANEGKTFIAINLALALAAESERGVVIIDGDLRNPSVHRSLGIRDTTGLADFLQSERSGIDSLIIDTDRRLSCIPAGRIPAYPLSLLDSDKMRWLISELHNRYDFVIIDTPPTAPLADSNILASLSDGLIFVIKAGETPLKIIQKSLKMLSKHKILGTVLNGTAEVTSYGYYNYNTVNNHKNHKKF